MNIFDLIMQAFSKYYLVHRIPMYTGQILVCLTSCWQIVQDNQDNDSDGTISPWLQIWDSAEPGLSHL